MVEEAPENRQIASSTKDEVMRRVRAALGDRKSDRESEYAYLPRHYHVPGHRSERERLDLFIDRLHDYGASVYECENAAIPQAAAAALRHRNIRKLLTGKVFPGGWTPPGFDISPDHHFDYDEINSFEGVITPCALAIAETGTIVLRHAGDEPRRAVSLIPDYHLCIVFSAQVVETVPEGIRAMARMGNVPLTTISGPSATSDIEMTRIKGVHGPRILDVILVTTA